MTVGHIARDALILRVGLKPSFWIKLVVRASPAMLGSGESGHKVVETDTEE